MVSQYDWNSQGVVVTLLGNIDIDEINNSTGVLHGDPRIEACQYTIWDFRKITNFSVEMEQANEPTAIDMPASSYIHYIKVAIVADDADVVEFCRHYIDLAVKRTPNWDFSLFSSMEDARNWVSF